MTVEVAADSVDHIILLDVVERGQRRVEVCRQLVGTISRRVLTTRSERRVSTLLGGLQTVTCRSLDLGSGLTVSDISENVDLAVWVRWKTPRWSNNSLPCVDVACRRFIDDQGVISTRTTLIGRRRHLCGAVTTNRTVVLCTDCFEMTPCITSQLILRFDPSVRMTRPELLSDCRPWLSGRTSTGVDVMLMTWASTGGTDDDGLLR